MKVEGLFNVLKAISLPTEPFQQLRAVSVPETSIVEFAVAGDSDEAQMNESD